MLYSASSLIFGTPFKSFPSFPSLACWAFILKITFNFDYSNTYTNQTYVILYGCYLSVICTDICLGSNQEILIVPQGGYLDGLTDLSSSRSITASKGHISYTHWSGNSWNLTSTSHPQTAFVPILALFFKSGGVFLVMRDMGNYFFFFSLRVEVAFYLRKGNTLSLRLKIWLGDTKNIYLKRIHYNKE